MRFQSSDGFADPRDHVPTNDEFVGKLHELEVSICRV
jgi:hypothetical protein